jgi:hypothetical protein
MELANRLSPSDEPQSGQAIVRYPLHFNQLQPRQRSSERKRAVATPTLFGAIVETALD